MRDRERQRRSPRRGQAGEAGFGEAGHDQHRADQDQTDRDISGERETADGGSGREQDPARERGDAPRKRLQLSEAFLFVARAQGLRGGTSCRLPRRRGGPQHGEQHAETGEERKGAGLDGEARDDAAEISGPEIGPDQRQGMTRERVTEKRAENGADDAG